MQILFFSLCVVFFLLVIYFLYKRISKLNKKINTQSNDTIPFIYYFDKKKFFFTKKERFFLSAKELSYYNFSSYIASKNKFYIDELFSNIYKIARFYSIKELELISESKKTLFSLNILRIDYDNNRIFGSLEKSHKLFLGIQKPKHKTKTSLLNYGDFYLSVNRSINLFKVQKYIWKDKFCFLYTSFIYEDSSFKYLPGTNRKNIINLIKQSLNEIYIPNVIFTIIDDEDLIIFVEKFHNTSQIENICKSVEIKLNSIINKKYFLLTIDLSFGIYQDDHSKNKTDVNRLINFAKIAWNQAAKNSLFIYSYYEQDSFFSIFDELDKNIGNLLDQKNIPLDIKSINVNNKLVASYFEIAKSLVISKEGLEYLMNWLFIHDRFIDFLEIIIEKSNKLKIINISFFNLKNNLQKIINLEKIIIKEKIVLFVYDYALEDWETLKWVFNVLKHHKIEFGLMNFKFFDNYVSLLNGMKPKYIFLSPRITKNLGKRNRSLVLMRMLNEYATAKNIILIAKSFEKENIKYYLDKFNINWIFN